MLIVDTQGNIHSYSGKKVNFDHLVMENSGEKG